MTGQQMLTMCSAIIKRQDINIDLLLMFINQQRKVILRANYLHKIQRWVTGFEPEDGFVSTDNADGTIKQVRYVEWNPDPEDNVAIDFNTNPNSNGIDSGRKKKLLRLNNMNEAYEIIDNVDAVGEPCYYVVLQGGIKVIPAPSEGVINIFGEWYPSDIQNTLASLAKEDRLDKEISDIVIYCACGEYFDFLEEYDKAELWRKKGYALLEQYLLEVKRQITDDRELMERDPFGNLGIHSGWRNSLGFVFDSDELTGGTPSNIYNNG